MSRQYSITEPHPTVSSHYVLAGRGGAGNFACVDPSKTTSGAHAQGPASRVKLAAPSSNGYYLAGRGGAGNAYTQRERAIFSFDEELERQRKLMDSQAPVFHIGRGGAGNAVDEWKQRRSTSSEASAVSSNSSRSAFGGAWDKVKGSLSKH